MNSVFLLGRLVSDPIIRDISTDSSVTNFSVAVSSFIKDKEYTNFFDCE